MEGHRCEEGSKQNSCREPYESERTNIMEWVLPVHGCNLCDQTGKLLSDLLVQLDGIRIDMLHHSVAVECWQSYNFLNLIKYHCAIRAGHGGARSEITGLLSSRQPSGNNLLQKAAEDFYVPIDKSHGLVLGAGAKLKVH